MTPSPWLLICTSVLFLFSCAPATTPQSAPPEAPLETHPPATRLSSISAVDLPCTEAGESAEAEIVYPGQSLYRAGAAFPSEEGLACLGILADWMKGNPAKNWRVTVNGEEGFGFDAVRLAEKRQALLVRYFRRHGIETSGWQWQAVSQNDAQLSIKSLP